MAPETPYERAYREAQKTSEAQKTPPDYGTVFPLLVEAHEAGDSTATYALGTWYLHGVHVKKNLRTAMAYLRQAAKEGHADALYDLAVSHEKGIGTKESPKMAAECYLAAILEGEKQSIYELGRCFYYGIGVEQNRRLARVLLDHADKLGLD